ncbi:HSF-type DNA-binding-domain-containing protein [Dichotomocladium elegans]|nr:HSF-type DNA-binding-domain-containing protein [Dichotomocladium elegans]
MSWNHFNVNIVNSSPSSTSPISSPLGSPLLSPSESPCDQLHNQFAKQISLQPPPVNSAAANQLQHQPSSSSSTKNSTGNTFVHKLYNMVVDKQYQHLIAWTYTGTSFIVCNISEFARDVLPKHFKHNNFSSFVRQLNMYGFHKINKSPRGHRALAENQIWEFSHSKFLRNRADLLDEIKRKALENDVVRRDQGDFNTHMAVMQVAQSDMMQQLAHLQENFSQIMVELNETRRRQQAQQATLKQMVEYMIQQGAPLQVPHELSLFDIKPEPESHQQTPPPIFITSPQNTYSQHPHNHQTLSSYPSTCLSTNHPQPSQTSLPSRPTPLPPSPDPSALLSDDENFYGPHSPHTPNIMQRSLSSNHLLPDPYMFQQHPSPQQQLSPTIEFPHHIHNYGEGS